jgi:hypothetical protein
VLISAAQQTAEPLQPSKAKLPTPSSQPTPNNQPLPTPKKTGKKEIR